MIGGFEQDARSKICFWNINRSEIDAERPNREYLAPSPVRSLCSNPQQPDILFVGFNNGDVRLLVDGDWSEPQMGHAQSVTATTWTNPQIVISGTPEQTFSDIDSIIFIFQLIENFTGYTQIIRGGFRVCGSNKFVL